MTDHNNYTTKLDSQELTSKLERIQKTDSSPDHGVYFSRGPRMSRSRTASSDPTDIMSRLPRFRKADTTSTMDSTNSISRLEVVGTIPSSLMSNESAEVEQGEFSKPTNMFKKRRESSGSEKGRKEFQYYGRHANSWLFNDFSVTDTVKKGWKALSRKEEDGKEE